MQLESVCIAGDEIDTSRQAQARQVRGGGAPSMAGYPKEEATPSQRGRANSANDKRTQQAKAMPSSGLGGGLGGEDNEGQESRGVTPLLASPVAGASEKLQEPSPRPDEVPLFASPVAGAAGKKAASATEAWTSAQEWAAGGAGSEIDMGSTCFMSQIPRNDAWDASQSIFSETVTYDYGSRSSRLPAAMSCTRGPRGVMSISFQPHQEESGASCRTIMQEDSTPPPPMLSGSFGETMTSPGAIKGSVATFVKGEILGHGQLGTVYKGLDCRTGQMFAIKEVVIDKKVEADMKYKEALENEISLYEELAHPHIVSYLGHDYINSSLYIYLEYMAGGSVAQVLGQFGKMDEKLIASYARDLLEGLEYLHSGQPSVLHRDIKGANILVGLDCRVKLADFGCSKRTADTMLQSLRGSIPWMAPEVIQQTGYGRRSDVWSFGCVLIEMATAKHPWGHFDNPMAAMVRIGMTDNTPPVPDTLSEVCQDFIRQCTQRDKNQRPHASNLLQHAFVQDVLMSSMAATANFS